ncbi:Protein yippee-like 2 [Folsomia candida]|uniref:Protein yippee-like 2 n=1 Tax=Folsomia candida TaxID=158441 RepID=A0A226EZ24_FOLCA|nr:Protein yippee-like 2 [Folsomia candida]
MYQVTRRAAAGGRSLSPLFRLKGESHPKFLLALSSPSSSSHYLSTTPLPTATRTPYSAARMAAVGRIRHPSTGEHHAFTANGTMVKTFQAYLANCHRFYSCVHCRAHLANHDELISKPSSSHDYFLPTFCDANDMIKGAHVLGEPAHPNFMKVNVGCGPAEERVLLTGLHAVADIYCECCRTTLGWKYEHAFESSQKYKEGKYIIELAHMVKENQWD